jgi:serine/threonine protein kinase
MADFKRLKETDLGDRYRIKGVLGEGGLGVVYEAYDNILKIDVAIKTLQGDQEGQGLVRLQREAMAAGKLKNVNIARVFDFGQTQGDDSLPYMVMELVSGKSLAELIKEVGRLDYTIAVPIFEQICLGLEHAHKNGIIHRDLKPSNVMLIELIDEKNTGNKYLVKLLDFGVAKIEADQSLTSANTILGSPLYMSPEQAQGDEVTIQSDFYSLGCLMFETLCGEPPLKGDSPLETMRMHINAAPPLVSEFLENDSIPKALVDLIDQCLHKKAEDRPFDALSINKTLEQIMGRNVLAPQQLEAPTKFKLSPIKLPDWTNKTLFKFASGASLIGMIILAYMYSHFQNTSLSKNVKLDDSINKKTSEPISSDLANLVGKSNCFEFITANSEVTVETKEGTVDEDFVELKDAFFTALKMKDCRAVGSGLHYINKIPLRKIELRTKSFEPKYFEDLFPIVTLKSLRVEKDKADSNMISQIVTFKNLEQLTLSSKLLVDKDFAMLAKLPKLKKLKLSGCDLLTDNVVDYLVKYPKLEALEFEHCSLMSENLASKIAKIKTLKSLNLPCNQNARSLSTLSKTNIEDLDVSGLKFNSAEFDALCSIKKLKNLHMPNIEIESNDYAKLNKLGHLEELDLSSEKLCKPALFRVLATLPVKRIDFHKSDINAMELNMLIDNKNLTAVNLDSCKKIRKIRKEFKRVYEKRWQREIETDFESKEEKELDDYGISPSVFDVPR